MTSPIVDETTGERAVIGTLSKMGAEGAVEAVEAASAAWDMGQGEWPQMSLAERIARVEAVVADLKSVRDEIVAVLMWEICKNTGDAAKEFDRTMEYVAASVNAAKESSTQVRRKSNSVGKSHELVISLGN